MPTTIATVALSNYVILYGTDADADKLLAVDNISQSWAKSQWQSQINSYPASIPSSDVVVIPNNSSCIFTCIFIVPSGTYNFTLRYLAPGGNSDSCFVNIDNTGEIYLSVPRTTSSSRTVSVPGMVQGVQTTSIPMESGEHIIVFKYRESMGFIELTISMEENLINNIIVPIIDLLTNPNTIYSAQATQ
jgi:hypothetical protein